MRTYVMLVFTTLLWFSKAEELARVARALARAHDSECNTVNFENCESEYFDFDVITGYEFYDTIFLKTIKLAGLENELPSEKDKTILDPMTYTFICLPYEKMSEHRHFYRSLTASQENESVNFTLLDKRMKHGAITSSFHSYLVLKRTSTKTGDKVELTLHAKVREGTVQDMGISRDPKSLQDLLCRVIIRDLNNDNIVQDGEIKYDPPFWETAFHWRHNYWRHYKNSNMSAKDGWYPYFARDGSTNSSTIEYDRWDRDRWNYERRHSPDWWRSYHRWETYQMDVTKGTENAQVMLYCRYAHGVAYVLDHFRYISVDATPAASPYCEPYTDGPKSPNPEYKTTPHIPPFKEFMQGIDLLGHAITPFILIAGVLAAFSTVCIATMLCIGCTRMKNRSGERRFNRYCQCVPAEIKYKFRRVKRSYPTAKQGNAPLVRPKCVCGT